MKNKKKIASNPVLDNWDPTKGNPFGYSTSKNKEKFGMPKIKNTGLNDGDLALPQIVATIIYNLHLKTIFETIKAPHQAKILQASEQNVYDKEKYVDGVEMVQDGNRIYSKKIAEISPITVYLNYPFAKTAEIKIEPYLRDGEKRMDLGFIIWQVSLAYADIYKNKWKEFGIWGHAFEDLYLEIMQIRKDGVITLSIGS